MRGTQLLLLALLGGCGAAASLKAVDATGDQISFTYSGDREAEAMRQATLYCANLGRGASLHSIVHEASDRGTVIFDCR